MADWFKKDKTRRAPAGEKKVRIPEGLFVQCEHCREMIYRKEIETNFRVCPKCNYHFPIPALERLALLLDEGSFVSLGEAMASQDPLGFRDRSRYPDRLKNAQKQTGLRDACLAGEGKIEGRPVFLVILDFAFMGGSLGSVMGEKIALAAERATARRFPLVIVSCSGGARMQEGILSLMQMAKTAAAINRHQRAGLPYLSVLSDPTFGGVSASFAMLGDIILAEPRSLVGFAGPRVIEQTIRQQLPEGFQRAEFLLEHGMLDLIVERKHLKRTLSRLLGFLS